MGMQSPEYEAMPIGDLCDMIVGALEESRMLAVRAPKER